MYKKLQKKKKLSIPRYSGQGQYTQRKNENQYLAFRYNSPASIKFIPDIIPNPKSNNITYNNLNAFKRAEIQSKITCFLKNKKYQELLSNDKKLKDLYYNKNKNIESSDQIKKKELKNEIIKTINDTLSLANIVYNQREKNKNNFVLNINKQNRKADKNVELFQYLGINLDSLVKEEIEIDIEKAWNYLNKLFNKDINIEILRQKIIKAVMYLYGKTNVQKNQTNNNNSVCKKQTILINNPNYKKIDVKKIKKIEQNPLMFNRLKMIDFIYGNNNHTTSTTAEGNKTDHSNKLKNKMEINHINLDGEKEYYDVTNFEDNSGIICQNVPCKAENKI